MKYLSSIFIILLFIASGCSQDNTTLNALKQENAQLKVENTKLNNKVQDLQNEQLAEIQELNQKVKSMQNSLDYKEKLIEKYKSVFKENLKMLTDEISVFNPDKLKKGDKIAGLTVLNIRREELNYTDKKSYYIDFTGEIEVKGEITINQRSGGYRLSIKGDIDKIPHSLGEFEDGQLFITILNEKDLEHSLGDKLKNLSPNDKLSVKVVLKNYSNNHRPATDVSDTADFVRVVNQI